MHNTDWPFATSHQHLTEALKASSFFYEALYSIFVSGYVGFDSINHL